MLRACLGRFIRDEDGAVTVDWVALAGALVGLGVLIVLDVSQGATDVSTQLGDELGNAEISDITFLVKPSSGSGSGSGTGSGSVAP